ncbi:MAG: glycosyltransferase [Hyphomicrobiales bacterium]
MSSAQTSGAAQPCVSVIIPCWNAAATLEATLASLRAQTFTNWEAILIDDGSTDTTPNLIAARCAGDSRFRSIKTNRLGPSAARNLAGLKLARGHYLAFLDSDDIWTPEKLSLSLAELDNNADVAGCYGQISFFRSAPERPETYSTVYPRRLVPADFLRDNPVCTMSNLVLRRDIFHTSGGFDESIIHNEDVEFLVRISAAGAQISGIDAHLVCYRTSITGLSANLPQMRAGWHKALATLQATASALPPRDVAAADAGNLRYLARRALRTGAPGFEALKLAAAGMARSPRSFLSPPWRGGMTLAGALAAPFLPRRLRALAFSR